MAAKSADLTAVFKSDSPLSTRQRVRLVISLSWPAVMAQLSSILMSYIDASMVGRLGASPAASIGLVATTIWLFFGVGGAMSTGFSVQVAHLVGASKDDAARDVARQSIVTLFVLGAALAAVGFGISGSLPVWLGGNEAINAGASSYFMIVALAIPFSFMCYLASGLLRCSGNMIVPGLMNVFMCVLDVVFNWLLIFDSHTVAGIHIPCAGLGVQGAALGTALAEAVTGGFLMWYLLRRSEKLNFHGRKFPLSVSAVIFKKAVKISTPLAVERVVMCGAQIMTTIIVAPLGTLAIAANSFGITAESLCYMPGYGVSDAATTAVGQSLGAGRRDLAHSFGKISIALGMGIMTFMGAVMWIAAPLMMSMFTPDADVCSLGVVALRTEAWAEPMFAASIVCYGVMMGAGYTLVPACINLGSIWVVRITLAALLAPLMGLQGVWLAMCIELCVRGAVFLVLFAKGRWMRSPVLMPETVVEAEDEAMLMDN